MATILGDSLAPQKSTVAPRNAVCVGLLVLV
jgi:hypothetical protein